ncbi:hypothetical protein ACJJTC_000380 [Scirpophaga incertulas]
MELPVPGRPGMSVIAPRCGRGCRAKHRPRWARPPAAVPRQEYARRGTATEGNMTGKRRNGGRAKHGRGHVKAYSADSASSKPLVVAQRLALEAQHARRVAEIEMGQIQAEREERACATAAERACATAAERAAVDAELRADIAALESR